MHVRIVLLISNLICCLFYLWHYNRIALTSSDQLFLPMTSPNQLFFCLWRHPISCFFAFDITRSDVFCLWHLSISCFLPMTSPNQLFFAYYATWSAGFCLLCDLISCFLPTRSAVFLTLWTFCRAMYCTCWCPTSTLSTVGARTCSWDTGSCR